MQKPTMWLAATAVPALLILAAVAGGEEKIALGDVPKPVMEAAKARFKDAKVTGAVKEIDDGKVVYEVSLKLKGKTIDMLLTPDGKIVLFEQEIAAEDLPKAVAKALADKYPKATYKLLEQVFKVEDGKEKLDFYEARVVTVAKKELEVKVTAEGKIQSEQEPDPD